MLHAAIYRAAPGSVVVVESGDVDYALAGGNVCAVAQRRGIAGFVADGVIRDLGEVREAAFPVFARGVIPIPGVKKAVLPLNERVTCGGVAVDPGDVVVAASSNPRHACGGPENSGVRATAIATKKGKKMSPHVSSSRPGRIDLIKRGAPTPITLRAKSSFTADHSR